MFNLFNTARELAPPYCAIIQLTFHAQQHHKGVKPYEYVYIRTP